MRSYSILFFLFLIGITQAQTQFKIIDDNDTKPIAFANIIFNDDVYSGTTSDIDGLFTVPSEVVRITISYVGYEALSIDLNSIPSNIIRLKQKISTLDEVVINSENPAHRIIRNAIANKAINNPEHLNSFTYTSYDKIFVDAEGLDVKQDTLNEIDDFLEQSYLFITETVAKRKYLKPKFSEDSIIATKTSGFKSPNFAFLANSIQPFSFYEDYITLFEIDYLNPISKGSTKKYKFRLQEEYLRGKDTIFAISFEPNANRHFEGLKGLIYINSNKYAVQSVDATTYNSGRITTSIQQKYQLINDEHWFPEQLNFQINIGEKAGIFKYVGKSYLSDVSLDVPLTKKDFPVLPKAIDRDAVKKDDNFWSGIRQDSLNKKEHRTYTVIDSIGDAVNFDKIATLSEHLAKGRFPFKYVDLDLTKIINYNQYEGLRLGAGFYTNDDIFKNLSIGGFAGYGLKDYEWKYGGELLIDIPSEKDITMQFKYENNLKETGRSYFNNTTKLFDARHLIAEQMDNIKAFSFKTHMKLYRNIDWTIGFNTASITPLYDYQFKNGNQIVTKYKNTEINFGVRYFVNEKLTNVFNTIARLESDDPVFNLSYSKGLSNVFDSDFDYHKIRFTMDDSFRIKGLGKTTYRIDAGYISESIPYGQLFTGEGSNDRNFPYVFQNYFQTLDPYEFLSDKYVHLFTSHNFGTLFNNKGRFTPEVILHNNIGIGNLSQADNHQQVPFLVKDKLYLETGLELRNLLKLNYLNVGYFGFGVGVFYRYGAHSLPDSNDNFAFKFASSFTFK